ncbi:hypothetical protein RI367_006468 [Sorochytrium milnesiophthora]
MLDCVLPRHVIAATSTADDGKGISRLVVSDREDDTVPCIGAPHVERVALWARQRHHSTAGWHSVGFTQSHGAVMVQPQYRHWQLLTASLCNVAEFTAFSELQDGQRRWVAAYEQNTVVATADKAPSGTRCRQVFKGEPGDLQFPEHAQVVAFARLSSYWIEPEHVRRGTATSNRDCVAVLFRDMSTGLSSLLMGLSKEGNAVVKCADTKLYVDAPADKGCLLIESASSLSELVSTLAGKWSHTKAAATEQWHSRIGYCTWNALGNVLSEPLVLQSVDKLQEDSIHPAYVIIDDGWQHTNNEGKLLDFDAHPGRFPLGLQHLCTQLKDKLKTDHHSNAWVGIWHHVLGYWGRLANTNNDGTWSGLTGKRTYRLKQPSGSTSWVVCEEDLDAWYDEFYRHLSSCGIDFVKIDGQADSEGVALKDAKEPYWRAMYAAHWKAHAKHFKQPPIHCMADSPLLMTHRGNINGIVLRSSQDFFPDQLGSHSFHVYTNVLNAVFLAAIHGPGCVLDSDMFATPVKFAQHLAALKVFLHQPIYISDPGNKHDGALLLNVGQSRGGDIVYPQPSGPGAVWEQSVWLGRNLAPTVVALTHTAHHAHAPVRSTHYWVANLSDSYEPLLLRLPTTYSDTPFTFTFSPSPAVDTARDAEKWLVWSWVHKYCGTGSHAYTLLAKDELDVVSLYPVTRLHDGALDVVVIGFHELYVPCSGVAAYTVSTADTRASVLDVAVVLDVEMEGAFVVYAAAAASAGQQVQVNLAVQASGSEGNATTKLVQRNAGLHYFSVTF